MYWLVDDPYLKTYRASHLLFPTTTALRGYDNFVGVFTHVKTIEILDPSMSIISMVKTHKL